MKNTISKYPPLPKFDLWLKSASPHLQQRLAELAHTSIAMYRQWTSGRRGISAATAGNLERAMRELAATEAGVPTPLRRGDMCETCAKCDYYKDAFSSGLSASDIDDLK